MAYLVGRRVALHRFVHAELDAVRRVPLQMSGPLGDEPAEVLPPPGADDRYPRQVGAMHLVDRLDGGLRRLRGRPIADPDVQRIGDRLDVRVLTLSTAC